MVETGANTNIRNANTIRKRVQCKHKQCTCVMQIPVMRKYLQCKYNECTSYVCATKRVRARCMWAMRQQATRPSVARRLRQKTLARCWGPRPRCARRRRALSRRATCGEHRLRKPKVPDLWWTVMSPRMLAAVLGPTKSFDPGLGSVSQTGSARQVGPCCLVPGRA